MSRQTIKSVLEFAEAVAQAKSMPSQDEEWEMVLGIFDAHISIGQCYVPETFNSKVQKWFGKIDDNSSEEAVLRVEKQTVVRIVNKWTYEQTLFNPLRASRPMNNQLEIKSHTEVADTLEEIPEKCDFCSPLSYTAVDLWGRIERDTCLTAGNCAKYDGFHSLVVFKDHSPLKYCKEKLNDIFSICEEWFNCANESNPKAIFPMFSWNCKGRAGASQSHGHAHLLLAEEYHYGRWEFFRHCAKQYNNATGQNYFLDLIKISKLMGLVKSFGTAHIVTNITPSFGYDFFVIGWNFDKDFRDAMDSAITSLLDRFKSLTFNIGIHFPPLEKGKIRKRLDVSTLDKKIKLPDGPMPFICYLVDRGDPSNGQYTSDVCGMKLYGSNIVSRDPFEIGNTLQIPDILLK